MIDTNSLLGVGFAIISQFTNVVAVSPDSVPTDAKDLQQQVIGGPPPLSPLHLHLVHNNGTMYSIKDGVVYRFEAPASYSHLQDPTLIPRFLGVPQLNSNQVLELAREKIEKLVKTGSPSYGSDIPRIMPAGSYRGSRVPFYTVDWRSTNWWSAAKMEIDARNGRIVYLHLNDPAFFDYGFSEQISNRFYKPDPAPKAQNISRKKQERVLPLPPTNQVVRAIAHWLLVCERFEISPGTQTNTADIDWDKSCIYTNLAISATTPVCQVNFKNGAGFHSVGNVIIDSVFADTYFKGDFLNERRDDWQSFVGRFKKQWEDVAQEYEELLVERFDFPKSLFESFNAAPGVLPAGYEAGTEDVTRVLIAWRKLPNRKFEANEIISLSETELGFSAEFDLQSGDIKGFGFRDRKIIELFGRSQLGADRSRRFDDDLFQQISNRVNEPSMPRDEPPMGTNWPVGVLESNEPP